MGEKNKKDTSLFDSLKISHYNNANKGQASLLAVCSVPQTWQMVTSGTSGKFSEAVTRVFLYFSAILSNWKSLK
jgi:hypothetical protein